jgi:hypothetical protein
LKSVEIAVLRRIFERRRQEITNKIKLHTDGFFKILIVHQILKEFVISWGTRRQEVGISK